MKNKIKHLYSLFTLLIICLLIAGVRVSFKISAEEKRAISYGVSNNTDSHVAIAASEEDIVWINGIPYAEVNISPASINMLVDKALSEEQLVEVNIIVNNGIITRYSGTDEVLSIPTMTTSGELITGIGSRAFLSRRNLKKIYIPASIASVSSSAFINCSSLIEIIFEEAENGVEPQTLVVSDNAFINCGKLLTVILPSHLSELGATAFSMCSGLKSIYIDEGCVNYKNGDSENGYGDVVYTAETTLLNTENAYIWPSAKKIYEIHLETNNPELQIDGLNVPAGYLVEFPQSVEGTEILGWYTSDDFNEENKVEEYRVTENEDVNEYTFYAELSTGESEYYTITFDLQGGRSSVAEGKNSYTQVFKEGEDIDISSQIITKDGYDFKGWYTLPAGQGDLCIDVTGKRTYGNDLYSQTLYAYWEAHQYILNFYDYNGTLVFTESVGYGTAIKAGLPERVGYDFCGWYDRNPEDLDALLVTDGENNLTTIAWSVNENKELHFYAYYTPHRYQVTIGCSKCSATRTQDVFYDAENVQFSLPCNGHDGYEVAYWSASPNGSKVYEYNEAVKWTVAEDTTLYAVWTPIEYEIIYWDDSVDISGQCGNDTSYTIEDEDIILNPYAPTGYSFVRWYDDNDQTVIKIEAGSIGTRNLYLEKSEIEITITLDYRGAPGFNNSTFKVKYGFPIDLPEKAELGSYGDAKWEDAQGNIIPYETQKSQLLSDVTYYALWEADVKLYGIWNTASGDTLQGSVRVAYGKNFYIPPCSLPGYTFKGWTISGTTLITNSAGYSLRPFSLTTDFQLYAKGEARSYTVTLNPQGGFGGTREVTAVYEQPMPISVDGLAIVCPTKEGYVFAGYYTKPDKDGTCFYDAHMKPTENVWNIPESATLYAGWDNKEVYITFNKQGGTGGTSYITVTYGKEMPKATAPTRNNYVLIGYFDQPNGMGAKYYDGPNMISVKEWDKEDDTTLYAYWRGAYYNISYQNITFMGQKAYITWDNYVNQDTPTYYEYGKGLDLSRVGAFWPTSSPYTSQLVFLGWYTNKNFTSKVTNISASATGAKTYYAKWRYDFNQSSRYGEYTITDADPYTEAYYDDVWLGLKVNNLYQELKNIGIKYIYIEFKLEIREIDDGYQEVLIYKDTSPSSNPIWSVTDIEHYPGTVGSTAKYYIWHCTFNIDEIKDCNYLYIRYGANGNRSDTWVTERIYMDVMYTTTTDSEEDVEEFTWDYSTDVKDEDCTPLEDVSDSY